MVMITGGAYQGKRLYCLENYNLKDKDIIDGGNCEIDKINLFNARCINNYHRLVQRLGNNSLEFTKKLCKTNKNVIIIINEIGCGIVPLNKNERVWRENVGRCGCIIASSSEIIIRMVCGIPTVIKDNLK